MLEDERPRRTAATAALCWSRAYLASCIQGLRVKRDEVELSEDEEPEASLAICSSRLILATVEKKVAINSSLLLFSWKNIFCNVIIFSNIA